MKIIVAEKSGFCYGVKKAVDKAIEVSKKEKNIYSLGPLIHNKEVTGKLEKLGLHEIEDIDSLKSGSTVIIRSHGEGKNVYDKAIEKKINIIDCTCPFVSKIHKIVNEFYLKKYDIIIIGDNLHPEVKGINGWCENNAIIVNTTKGAAELDIGNRSCVVAQTTFNTILWDEIIGILKSNSTELLVNNTICSATYERQNCAIEVAKQVKKMIVVGDKKSSNSRKLYDVCSKFCDYTIMIETVEDLQISDFAYDDVIGITAGASTPDWIIKEIINKLEGEEIHMYTMEDAIKEIDESFKVPRKGDIVKGRVVQIQEKGIVLNIGYKNDAMIPKDEISSTNENAINNFQIDDEITAFVLRTDDGEGNVLLSIKKMKQFKDWDKLEDIYGKEEYITVRVGEILKGGVTAYYNEVRGFIPASHLDSKYVSDLKSFKGKELEVKIIEINKRRKRIVFSRKELAMAERAKKLEAVWEKVSEGEIISGIVKRITNFGVFVDIGGIDGLVHLSELSWGRIKSPKEVVAVNDEIDVKVLSFDKEKEKVSLSIKQISGDPWGTFNDKYNMKDIFEAKIVNLTDFGGFAELEPGIEGLIHVSQISKKRIAKPADVLNNGDIVKVKLIEVEVEDRKLKLSMKAVEEESKEEAKEDVKEETLEETKED